ncbi:hypothetical protein L211DRAFT_821478 [Terfezia boudieri ATCC MYA-4762]|uniref:DNA endonuclease activator Ctp1 C-terminal domain-containing protein n=1 Tax=Terfezia boudieri ATCC MYA-4762 TaxID=1051890 RepID=A0A3N4LU01_9PEZI|nr:hypothetical protein L211DRAFT_821478 [Terfezia boudieri ATCC MYA-4762]
MEVTQITRRHRVGLFNAFTKAFGELEAELLKREEAVIEEKLKATILEHNAKPEDEIEPGRHEQPPGVNQADIIELQKIIAALIKENEDLRKRNSELEDVEALKQDRTLRSRSANKENIENAVCGMTNALASQQHTVGPTVGIQTEIDAVDASPQYEELAKKYEQMRQQVKHYREAHTILVEKYRRNKAVWKQWVEQDRLRRQKSEKLKAQLNATRRGATVLVTPARSGSGGLLVGTSNVTSAMQPPIISSPALLTAPAIAETQWSSSPPATRKVLNEPDNSSPTPLQQAPISHRATPGTEQVANYDSDHTTDGEGELRVAAFSPISHAVFNDGEQNDSPRLPKPPARVKAERFTQSAKDVPVYIKSETRSSNSVLDHIAFSQHSLDLDDLGYRPETPRKRKYMSNYQSRAQKNNVTPTSLRHRLTVVSQAQEEELQDGYDEAGEEDRSRQSGATTVPNFIPTPRSSGVKISIQEDSQPADMPLPAPDGARPKTSSKQAPRKDAASHCLSTTSQRKQAVSTPGKEPVKPAATIRIIESRHDKKTRDPKTIDSEIGFMTEDGTNRVDTRLKSISTDKALSEREVLKRMLDTPPVKVPSIAHLRKSAKSKGVTPAHSTIDEKEDGGFRFRTPVMQGHLTKRNIPVTDPPVSKKAKFTTGSERKPARDETLGPQYGRLRARNAKDLNISDFAINADKARGFRYAYQEVIRKRDERKCLPGCIGSCCKELREFLAKAGMPPELPSKAPKWRSSPIPGSSQMPPDEEEFEEDEEEPLQVDRGQLRQFVDKFAKHRNMFDRDKSPEGFWASEFPDTQEMHERKTKAKGEERKKVADMKREAGKRGGRWVFRDEV